MHPHVTKQLIAWFCSISLHLLHFHLMLDNYMQTQYKYSGFYVLHDAGQCLWITIP